MKKLIVSATLACATATAFAAPTVMSDGGTNAMLALRDSFKVFIDDNVSDGCLPQPKRLIDRMEINLRKNGFTIEPNDGTLGDFIFIVAHGYETSGSLCVVNLSVNLDMWALAHVPGAPVNDDQTVIPYRIQMGAFLFSGPKNLIQDQAEKNIDKMADDFYLRIDRARDDAFSKFPTIKAAFDRKQ